MKAGRELDALIAEKVMGITEAEYMQPVTPYGILDGIGLDEFPQLEHYSTNIADAWKVVEKLQDAGWMCDVMSYPTGTKKNDVLLEGGVFFRSGLVDDSHPDWAHHFAQAKTPSLAICLAALKAVGVKI